MPVRTCLQCQGPIEGKRAQCKWAKYCSKACAKKSEVAKYPKGDYPHLTSPTVGALHELLVAADMLKHGLQVFRALSASCDCDLAALAGKKLIRVEVTTGYKSGNGVLTYPHHKAENFDVLAVVSKGGIHYFPPMAEWFTSLHKPSDENRYGGPAFGSEVTKLQV